MYGNSVGDSVLQEVANNIYTFSQPYELLVFRVHADVFAVYSEEYDIQKFEKLIKKLSGDISIKRYHGDIEDILVGEYDWICVGEYDGFLVGYVG